MEAFAMGFAEGVTTSLLGKLGNILAEEAGLLAGVEDDIQYIMEELKSMDSFLAVLSSSLDHNKQVKTWMEQVRDLAYDAEDCVDVFRHRLRRPRHQHPLAGVLLHTVRLLRTLKARHSIATDLRKLKLRARDVSERRARYALGIGPSPGGARSFSSSTASSSSGLLRRCASFVKEVGPMGMDHYKREIVGRLMEENDPQLKVISIVGIGGLGKTTLAKMVYQSSAVTGGYFQARAWIEMPRCFKIEPLLRNMIRQFSSRGQQILDILGVDPMNPGAKMERVMEQHLDKMGETQLVTAMVDYLKDKRYVIVLDDMWTVHAWDHIKSALPSSTNGSWIIVTTRNEAVPNACGSSSHCFIYNISPLTPKLSNKLFCERAFPGPIATCPRGMENLTVDMVKKCSGIPLSIVTVAGLIAAKPDMTPVDWQNLQNHLPFRLKTNIIPEKIKRILLLCYIDLPHHLRPCFLYLTVFPKDYDVERKRLVRRWVAEGLVSGSRGMSAEEAAEGYFIELISRRLIQPSKITGDGKVKTCRVHDIMLEVIDSITSEENFVTVLHEHSTPMLHGKIRRLSLHGMITQIHGVRVSHVRSLTVFGDGIPFHNYGRMRLLRVLDLQGCKGLRHNHLKNISQLFLLSFLSLRNSSVEKLPDSIGDLPNLQTLDIRGTGIKKFPGAAVKLKKLAYLLAGTKFHFEANRVEFSGSWSYESLRMPTGVGKMKGLRKLGLITVTNSIVLRQIGKLTQLQKLSIDVTVRYVRRVVHIGPEYTRRKEHFVDLLSKLDSCLRSLTILDNGNGLGQILNNLHRPPLLLHDIQLVGFLQTLPVWVASLNRIVKITLRFTFLMRDAVRVLKNLPALAQLVLGYNSLDECDEQLVFDHNGFKGLKLLHMESVDVSFREGALPNLEWLKLIGHFGDQSISGMQHLHSLKEVYLDIGNERLQEMIRTTAAVHLNRPKFVIA
ncbi:disease resistance protein Pik-2-like [Musa acuminata AAA Group]|uniref:disease resistance protein Pik-2-like n=1 Tax=Musa acuminata AAA Group TaxID=214697 RepID=UPI0031D031DE